MSTGRSSSIAVLALGRAESPGRFRRDLLGEVLVKAATG
jgi:hypothetical protein